MLDDFLLQFFDAKPRRELALYLLLTGKKTVSVLFAALEHHQLQWLQLYPTLPRADFQAAIGRLQATHALEQTDTGLILIDPAAKKSAQQRVSLPTAYQPWMGVHAFGPRFHLAVQMLSEASFHNARYRPVTQDWAIQQSLRRWWQGIEVTTTIAELKTLLASLDDGVAKALLSEVIGHDFVGAGDLDEMRHVQVLSQLIAAIEASDAPSWQALWGGRKPLGTKTQYLALQMIQQGASRQQVSERLHLKPSTINEHLLTAAIFGAEVPLAQLYPPAMRKALASADATLGYQPLLETVADSDFFQIRLFQILSLQGRWPHGQA